jgi:cell fate regulator YaaT (PSP1 superfamily)
MTELILRLLIKDFAKEFSTRIEMKQVGFRQEAARLGGIGSCGRECAVPLG